MGRAPCCSKVGLHRGPWTPKEDSLLIDYIRAHGEGDWRALPKKAGLLRCGKSCRLRWMNYLRPDIKRGNITPDEDDLIIRLHALLGNRWSLIAGRLPGRTDNEIKNYWNTHLAKKLKSQGTHSGTHKKTLGLDPARPTKKKRPNKQMTSDNAAVVVHQPKPVRVTALSLKRNDSNASFESNVTSESTPASNGSCGAAAYWPSDQDGMMTMMMEESAVDDDQGGAQFLIGSEEEGEGVQGFMMEPRASDQGMLDKLYEEYLQLIKVDDDDGLIGLDVDDHDGDQALELDSFAESLLN